MGNKSGFKMRMAVCLLAVFFIFVCNPVKANAETLYVNAENGNAVQVLDEAALFSADDIAEIAEGLKSFTAFGNALVATTGVNDHATVKQLAVSFYDRAFGISEGAVFLIDMDDREIYLYTEGDLYKKLSVKRAMAITDNVYKYASNEKYGECAKQAFAQATRVLEGGRIAEKLKYWGNGMLALILSLMVNYTILRRTSYIKHDGEEDTKLCTDLLKLTFLEEKSIEDRKKKSPDMRLAGTSWGGRYSSFGNYGDDSDNSSYSGSSSYSDSSSHSGSSSSYTGGSGSYSTGSSGRGSSSGGSSGHHGGGAGHRF